MENFQPRLNVFVAALTRILQHFRKKELYSLSSDFIGRKYFDFSVMAFISFFFLHRTPSQSRTIVISEWNSEKILYENYRNRWKHLSTQIILRLETLVLKQVIFIWRHSLYNNLIIYIENYIQREICHAIVASRANLYCNAVKIRYNIFNYGSFGLVKVFVAARNPIQIILHRWIRVEQVNRDRTHYLPIIHAS